MTEIDIPNPDGALRPGVYCTVELKIPRKSPSLLVPAEALVFNRDGLQVAVFNDGKSEIRKVRVTRDLGTRVEVDVGNAERGDRIQWCLRRSPVRDATIKRALATTLPKIVHEYLEPEAIAAGPCPS